MKSIVPHMKNIFFTAEASHISRAYTVSIAGAAVFGIAAAATLLIELASPRPNILDTSRFGVVLTAHGMTMVFLVLIPLFHAVLGNLVLPKAVGAQTVAAPRTNLLGWHLYVVGALAVIIGVEVGGYQGGWKMVLPPEPGSRGMFTLLVVGLVLVAVSSILLNFSLVRTIVSRRHRTIAMNAVPLFGWFFLFGSLMQLVTAPARLWFLLLHAHPMLESLLVPSSGLTNLHTFKLHLFWMYANPAILSAMLPAIGVACAAIAGERERVLFPRRTLLLGGIAFSLLSMVSWGQHLLTAVSGQVIALAGAFYSLLSIVPATVMFVVLLRGWLRSTTSHPAITASLFGQVTTFTVLALSGMALATPSVGVHLHNTYTSVGHLHYGTIGIALLSFAAGVSHWQPEFRFHRLHGRLATMSLYGVVAGLHATFIPLMVIGFQGAPRAYHEYAPSMQSWHVIAAFGGALLIVSLFVWIFSVWRGGKVRTNEVTARTPTGADPVLPPF